MRAIVVSGAMMLGSLALAAPAGAAVLASESFDYSAGALVGQNGGSGFSTPWRSDVALTGTSTANSAVQASSLVTPSNYLGASGGSGTVTSGTETSPASAAARSIARGLDTPAQMSLDVNDIYYFSFIVQAYEITPASSGPPATNAVVASWRFDLDDSTGSQTVFKHRFVSSGAGNVNSQGFTNGANALGAPAAKNTPLLIVAKITAVASGSDTVSFPVYKPTDTVPVVETFQLTAPGAAVTGTIDRLVFWSQTSGSYTSQIDEIRFGESWADVVPVPEPTSFAAVAMAAGAMLVRRRRAGH